MADFNVGDRVKVEAFEGELTGLSAHRGCAEIRDNAGYVHFIFPHGSPATVTKVEPPRPEHQIVRDDDGDVFIYEPSEDADNPWRLVSKPSPEWITSIGTRHHGSMLTLPLTVLG